MIRDIKILEDTKLMKKVFSWISSEFNKGEKERGEDLSADYEPWSPQVIEYFFVSRNESMMETVARTLKYKFGHKDILEIIHFSECDRYEIKIKL